MRKIIISSIAVFLLCGCSLGGGSGAGSSFLKTTDGGEKWESKVETGGEKNIAGVSILSMVADPNNSDTIYIGTAQSGIFKSENGGEKWFSINFPPTKVYGLAVDRNNSQRIFATGTWNGVGKIYRSDDGGENWSEIYNEPAAGTVMTSLAISPFDNRILYAGTSEGALYRSDNAGETWYNLYKAPAAVIQIVFDGVDPQTAYFLVFKKTVLITRNGKDFKDLEKNIKGDQFIGNNSILSLANDPGKSGTIYVGHDKGITRSNNFGENWSNLDVLESSKSYPVRAMAVNPSNSNEIIYCAAQAVYKSIDGGVQWSTFELATSRQSSILMYNKSNPAEIYLSFKIEN